ncbi:1-phosphatidylinositol 4,5-bisphosphate phosphodiesterase classes I and II [Galendromus occidentalis]|uniref:1-phosphatidylinositol 4,5-bisphosphate phosphodiesterase n=1 Tax=Galendromus occidentalis TaxID=34638 RepID=A0AAJ7SEU7_9ACAR|nr:1-phosphatidylinositol 4,5-bisphosphate phosphodiesterase classes I and II [Galendromus occidentalis]
MAGAKAGIHVVQLKPILVSKALQDGNKFVKWDEDSPVGTPVTLKVDNKGFYLFWTDQNNETEYLEISSIRDTRTGKHAKTPKEGKLRDSVNIGAKDATLEDKTVTVVYGADYVNVSFISFCCNSREVAQQWADELLGMATNLLFLNAPVMTYLEKMHTRILLSTDKEGKIPVKSIVKMFANHKDDRRRVEKCLETTSIANSKGDSITPEKLTFDSFYNFYRHLTQRSEVEQIFEELCGASKKKVMNTEQLVNFLNREQRDPRLNEILYPYANPDRARDLIKQYEPNKSNVQKGVLSFEGFLKYLLSEDNAIIAPEKIDLSQDMDQPLNHYFINSSHNTYLTGHQLTGKSSVEMYRQCLLSGCRCIELDCWNGRNSDEEPIITHGYTVVTEILLKEVIEAIADSAFKTSQYPVILSFENHCSPKQQAKMAQYCTKIFGDMLLNEPLSSHPLKSGVPLPSPNQLLRKIIIKNKKKHHPRPHKPIPTTSSPQAASSLGHRPAGNSGGDAAPSHSSPTNPTPTGGDVDVNASSAGNDDNSASYAESDGSEGSDTDEEESAAFGAAADSSNAEGTAANESEAVAEMSALVNYCQPVRFHSFEYAERRDRSYEISSFVETQATNLLKEHPVEFVNYNKRQLSRIYPSGTRVSSSNYMPQVFWNAGCQLVALNFQTMDLGMQLNLGIFEMNARCGYLQKPDFMRRHDRRFDPFAESTVDGIIAGTVSIRVISGHLLTERKAGTYVEVDMYGLPADTVRRRFRTRTVTPNGLNPIFNEDAFVFKKVVLPDLAVIRVQVCEENGRFLGHRILPVVGLRPGYRFISLRNEAGQPLTMPALFVRITVGDYVPDGLSELADALANPIRYQSRIEKHATQLLALTGDDEEDEIDVQATSSKSHESNVEVSGSQSGLCSATSVDQHSSGQNVGTNPAGSVRELPSAVASLVNEANGTCQSPTRQTSPQILLRQDTMSGQPASLLSDMATSSSQDSGGTPAPSLLLETSQVTAQGLDKIRETKTVVKVLAKLDKDLQSVRKKYEKKLKDRERDSELPRDDKLIPHNTSSVAGSVASVAGRMKIVAKTTARLGKKMSCGDVFNQRPDSGPSEEQKAKMERLQKTHAENVAAILREQYKTELQIQQKHSEAVFGAMEKAMLASQAQQLQQLQELHDKEAANLMKRLESSSKEEMKLLIKKHKDKNELDRIKRELQNKMIGEAVAERQKMGCVLEKKRKELEKQHEDVRRRFEEEKSDAAIQHQKQYNDKCAAIDSKLAKNPALLLEISASLHRHSQSDRKQSTHL